MRAVVPWTPTATFMPGPPTARPLLTTPDEVAAVIAPTLAGLDREVGMLLALDTRHRLIEPVIVSVGTAAHTFLSPREIYRDALMRGASAIVVAHNHPSGDPQPSDDDIRVTARLAAAGRWIGVELLDHVIMGGPGWRSLARMGEL